MAGLISERHQAQPVVRDFEPAGGVANLKQHRSKCRSMP